MLVVLLSQDASQEYFSDGLTEELIAQLANLDPTRLGVIARTSAMRYKNTSQGADQIARDLRVDYLLEGSVRRDRNRSAACVAAQAFARSLQPGGHERRTVGRRGSTLHRRLDPDVRLESASGTGLPSCGRR
jgi:hypothetical protein